MEAGADLLREAIMAQPLFDLGLHIVATPGALALLERFRVPPALLLHRHVHGDWGTVDAHDAQVNTDALRNGARILSSYDVGDPPERVWIITDAVMDSGRRYATTLLLPSEY